MDCNINFTEFNTPVPWIETLKNIYRDSDICDLEERTRILKEYLNNARKYTNQNDYFKGSIKAIRERFRKKKRSNDKNSSNSSTSIPSNDLKARVVKVEAAIEELYQLLRNTIDAHILPPTLSKTVDVQCGQDTLINKSKLYYKIQDCFATNPEFLLNFKELSEYLQGPGPYKMSTQSVPKWIKKVGGAIIPLFKLIDRFVSEQLKVAPVVDILKQKGDPNYIVEIARNKITIDAANNLVEQEEKDLYPHNIITIEGATESDVLFSLQKLWYRFDSAKNVVCSRNGGRFLDRGLVWKILISILIHELYHIRFYLTEVRDDEDEYGLDTSQDFILYSQKFIQS